MIPPFRMLTPTGAPVSLHDQLAHHGEAHEAPHDARDRGEQLDHDLERLAHPGRAELREVDRGPEAEGHGEGHGERGDAEGADGEGERPVADVVGRGRVPLGAEEELPERELVPEEDGRRLAQDEEEDRGHEEDRAHPAQADRGLDGALAEDGPARPLGPLGPGWDRGRSRGSWSGIVSVCERGLCLCRGAGPQGFRRWSGGTGTYPLSSTTFWPASDRIQSMYCFTAPCGSPSV